MSYLRNKILQGCECCPFSVEGDIFLLAKDGPATCCCIGDDEWESTGDDSPLKKNELHCIGDDEWESTGDDSPLKKNELHCAAVVEDKVHSGIHIYSTCIYLGVAQLFSCSSILKRISTRNDIIVPLFNNKIWCCQNKQSSSSNHPLCLLYLKQTLQKSSSCLIIINRVGSK